LRSVMLFSIAAFSIAKAATCSDFEVFANGTAIGVKPGNSSNDFSIMRGGVGENLTFTVSPEDENTIVWTRSGFPVYLGPSYDLPIDVNVIGNVAQDIELKVKNCGVEKTIVIKLLQVPYKVTFNSDGGSSVPGLSVTPEPDGSATVPEPTPAPTKIGYEFDGWKKPDGTDCNFPITINDDITLTAKWKPEIYDITLDPQNGSATSIIKVEYGKPMASLTLTPTRTGYTFIGWNSNIDGRGTTYTSTGPNYTVPSSITLYAQWEPAKYTISFNINTSSCVDGSVNPADIRAQQDELITLPTPMPTRADYEFESWTDGIKEYEPATPYQVKGDAALKAKWKFKPGTTPTIDLLAFNIPSLTYTGVEIAANSVDVHKKIPDPCGGNLNMTVLYNGKSDLPKDAGTYAISVSIAQNADYAASTIPLGSMVIARAVVTAASIGSGTVNVISKDYDATSEAEIDGIPEFIITPAFCGGGNVSLDDYKISAYFNSPNAGRGKEVKVTVEWKDGPLSKNCDFGNFSPLVTKAYADINRAKGVLSIEVAAPYDKFNPPFYEYTRAEEYSNPTFVEKNVFIPDSVIKFYYKRDGEPDEAYTEKRPNRLGKDGYQPQFLWWVKAVLEETVNYTGAEDSVVFRVERGNAYPVSHKIEIPTDSEKHFTRDPDLSGELREYFVGNVCDSEREDSIKITITTEPEIYLELNNFEVHKQGDESTHYYFNVPFNFGKSGVSKPGLDTLIYTLNSNDGVYKEYDTLFIEVPIAFDSIAKQKWNNVLLINNNPKNNGGYEFTDFKWFKNDKAIDSLQFYSAGPRSTDALNPNDKYKVTMHTKDGIRISTCEGKPKSTWAVPAATEKNTAAKRVLGINGKTAKPEQKVYNAYGAERKDTPAGVYIIKDK